MKKIRISMTIDQALVKRLDRVAKQKRVSRSAEIETAVRDHLDSTELMVKAFANDLLRDAFIRAFSAPGVARQFAEVMQEELSDEQLRLFSDVVQKLAGAKKTSD